jgi:hypothetical protein
MKILPPLSRSTFKPTSSTSFLLYSASLLDSSIRKHRPDIKCLGFYKLQFPETFGPKYPLPFFKDILRIVQIEPKYVLWLSFKNKPQGGEVNSRNSPPFMEDWRISIFVKSLSSSREKSI